MGLAIMVASPGTALSNGDEVNLGGYSADSTTEPATQASCTEDATFSMLAFNVRSGGSGTNSLRFRDAGANGNQLAEIAGTGIAEDATNSDSLTAGDLFNLAYTDTGSNSTAAWIKANISFSSGHGSIHISAHYSGQIYDAASSTVFLAIAGNSTADGVTDEAWVAFKARGYDTYEAMQVNVTANARTNDSIFKNRINNADGTGVITFGAGITGLLTDTAIADSISDGQVVDMSLTLDTGVEDLTISFVAVTFKSSTGKQDIWCGAEGGIARAGSTTANYEPIGGAMQTLTNLTEANAAIKAGFAATVSNVRAYCSANTYTGDGTLILYVNGSPVITTTITAGGGAAWYENTSSTTTIDADDVLSFELDEGTSGSATFHMIGLTFAPIAAPVAAARMMKIPSILDGLSAGGTFFGNVVQ